MQSIKEKDVLEPIIVTRRGDKYLLLCGERRFPALIMPGEYPSIPAIVLDEITDKLYGLTEEEIKIVES